jgi:hypothetical protein
MVHSSAHASIFEKIEASLVREFPNFLRFCILLFSDILLLMKMKKEKKELKKPLQTSKTDADRYVGAILEDVNHKFDVLIEGYGSIDSRLGHVETRLGHAEDKLNVTVEMVGSIAVNMEIVKQDIEIIKGGLRKKIDADEFSALERRVVRLEQGRGVSVQTK